MASGAYLRVEVTCNRLELDEKSASLVHFRIHPSSSHSQMWGSELLITTQIFSNFVELTVYQFLSHDTTATSDTISRLLPSSLDLDPKVKRVAVSKIKCAALDILAQDYNSKISRNSYKWIMNVQIRVVTMYQEVVKEDDHSVEEFTNGSLVVPARLSSIQELKKRRIQANNGNQRKDRMCAICRAKFPIGSPVTCIPCSHFFHDRCLFSWLSRSRCCPLCRFQMPTPNLRVNYLFII